MFIYIARFIVIVAGPVIGYMKISSDGNGILIGTGAAILVILAEIIIQKVRLDDIIAGGLGLIIGLIIASIINYMFPLLLNNDHIAEMFKKYQMLVSIVLAYIGMIIGIQKKGELDILDKELHFTGSRLTANMKIVDTSAIIDARMLDVVETGFLEGILVIPVFIMNEVQALADSPDEEKRNRARRALDIVNELRKSEKVIVKIYEKDFNPGYDNDTSLIRAAYELKAKLLTTDYNLNKAATAQGVDVLNINDLANALKPKMLPGEEVDIFIMKKGKDPEQGIGYLDDGTMVVVDGAEKYLGSQIKAKVRTVLQKAAGRMIFARID